MTSRDERVRRAGLVYVSDRSPGISRERRGRGFCYRYPDGDLVTDPAERARMRALGIPPAYEKVWICIDPQGHLQATGYDARGRKQYRYHPDWSGLRAQEKFDQLIAFGEALPRIRRRAQRDAAKTASRRIAILAALVLLLDAAHLRVGNRSYREENGSFGATTLLKRHISFGDMLELEFKGKGGRPVRRSLRAPRLQHILEDIADLPGRSLFAWRDPDGSEHAVDSGELNGYLAEISGRDVSSKTFRTWGGTLAAFECAIHALARQDAITIRGMCDAAAAELANTPAVCRKSYVHPAILDLASDESARERLSRQLSRPVTPKDGLRQPEQRLLTYLRSARRASNLH